MFIEHLQTTHEGITVPLKTALEDIQGETVHAQALLIARFVHDSIRFSLQFTRRHGITPEDITKTGLSDCYGFTLVTSEALEHNNVQHSVAYANDHAFAVANTEKTSMLMVDSLSLGFTSDMEMAIPAEDFIVIPGQMKQFQRSVFMLQTELYTEGTPVKKSFQQLSDTNAWLSNKSTHIPRTVGYSLNEHKELFERRIVATMMPPEIGRTALTAMRNANAHTNNGEFDVARHDLQSIYGFYPEMDARNKLPYVQALMAYFAVRGDVVSATDVCSAVSASHGRQFSLDTRLHSWRGDALVKIGYTAKKKSVIEEAIKCYAANPKAESGYIQTKIKKAKRMYAQID